MKKIFGLLVVLALVFPLVLGVLYPYMASGLVEYDEGSENYSITNTFEVYEYYDGELYKHDDNYTTAHDSPSASHVNNTRTYMTLGQDNTTPYKIYRDGLQFDTSKLPFNASISSATLYFRVKSDSSTTDFNITLVEGSSLSSPMVTADYENLYDSVTSFGALTTAGISTSAYSSIDLTAEGLAQIVRSGITKFGVRSSLDIAGTAPANGGYVQIWSSESDHRPYLEVTYTLSSIPAPDLTQIVSAKVYSDYKSDNDQLYVIMYKVIYNDGDPNFDPSEYFTVRLFDTDNTTLKAQVTLPAWGYKPVGIYLGPSSALQPNKAYMISLQGTSKYGTPVPSDNKSLGTSSVTWKGTCASKSFGNWVIDGARDLEDFYEEDYVVKVSNVSKLNFDGGVIYSTGIPGLASTRPDLFASSEEPYDWEDAGTYDPTFKNELLNNMGTQLMTSFGNIGNSIGLSATWVNSGFWGCFALGIVVVSLASGMSIAGLAVGIPALMLGLFMGIPPVIGALFGIGLMFLLARTLWAARG